MDIDIVENNDVFKSNNELYTALTGDDSDLCTTETFSFDCNKDFEQRVHVDGTKHVYLHVDIENTAKNRGAVTILINGKKADLCYFGSDINYNYPNNFHNELIDLGVVTDEDIDIYMFALKNVGSNIKVTVGYFDYTKLESLCEMNKDNHAVVETGPKSLSATVISDDDESYVFLPVTYDEGWSCNVNGEKQNIDIAMSSFMAVKLHKGENVIEMNYLPYGMKLGAFISVLTMLAVAAIYIIEKKKPFNQEASNRFLKVFEKIYYAGMTGVLIVVYVVPVIFTIYNNITG